MDAERFAKGFERDPRDYASLPGKRWRNAKYSLMDPALRWSYFFSQLVDNHLTQNQVAPKEALQMLQLYTSTTNRQLLQNVIGTSREVASHRSALAAHLNTLNFHTINQEVIPYWNWLVDPDEYVAPDYIDLSLMQTRLSIQGLALVSAREHFYEQMLIRTPVPADEDLFLDESFAGQITEVDAAITLLEMLKQQPFEELEHLIVVPAPPKYEMYGDKASDFLLFDTSKRQARGIQVKTRLRGKGKYNQDFVSFIDGVYDLGNYTEYRGPDNLVRQRVTPGLIAADFILNNEGLQRQSVFSKMPELEGFYGPIVHSKEIAASMGEHMQYIDRAARAAEEIGPRIMQALYENGDDEEDRDETEPDESPSSE